MTEEMMDRDFNTEGDTTAEESKLPDLSVNDIVFYTISMLVEQAWVKMGLRTNPATNEVTKDLDEARLAIDSVSALINVVQEKQDQNVKNELNNLVSTLQMNYVNQSTKE